MTIMSLPKLPFNITLLSNSKIKAGLQEITTLDIYDGQTTNFHPNGLFSTQIFGRVGEEIRDKNFAFIDLKVSVMHPTLYKTLTRMRALYQGIMAGKMYATFDVEQQDFVSSDEQSGKTGYAFFMRHYKDISFTRNNSKKRDLSIDLLTKYQADSLVRRMVVIPAGIRDIVIENNGSVKEDEINALYRRAISIARTVDVTDGNVNNEIHDSVRYNMQLTFNAIYETLRNILEGKKGFIQGKWGSRKILNGTRNVISAMDVSSANANDLAMPTVNDTMTGLYQSMKGCLPVTIYCVKRSIVSEIFSADSKTIPLVNKKTFQLEQVEVSSDTVDLWTSAEGIEKLISGYVDIDKRHEPIEIGGHYLGLIYDDGERFKVFNDMSQFPDGENENGELETPDGGFTLNRKYVRPLTWCEYFYTACYERFSSIKVVVTRYPVTGLGSTYPSNLYLRTTVKGFYRIPLDDNWLPDTDRLPATQMPDTLNKGSHVDTGQVHSSRLQGLGGDFDGRQYCRR